MKLVIRWAINAVALYVTVLALPNFIHLQGEQWNILWLAFIFGLVNAILRPPARALSCLLIILTLGLFTFVINALLFALTGWLGTQFGVGFTLAEPWFWSALLGSLITSAVSVTLSFFLRDTLKRKHRRK